MSYKFSAKIKIINGNPYVDVPEEILKKIFKAAKRFKGPIPVKGTINGADYIQTLMRYEGEWRLYVNMIMLKAADIKFPTGKILDVVGKMVDMTVEYDSKSRDLDMNPKLQNQLDKDSKAKNAYEALAPYRKFEILRYLSFLKTEESTDLNIGRIIKHLRGEETDALYPLMHRKKKD